MVKQQSISICVGLNFPLLTLIPFLNFRLLGGQGSGLQNLMIPRQRFLLSIVG